MSTASEPIRIAVVTGGHSYDVPSFHKFFRSISDADIMIQHMDDFASSPQEVREDYAAVVFYTMLMETPTDEGIPWYAGKPRQALEHLGQTEQGIFVLHHALLSYPEWPIWNEIVGIHDRRFGFDIGESIHVQVVDPNHPITRGLSSWTMIDETYKMADAEADSQILLTVDHPKSMRTLGWARRYRKSRVFCLQSGHDPRTWENEHFREVIRRGILWCGRQI